MSDANDGSELQELNDSGLFDGALYLERNDDVRDADLDPLQHFHRHGWREGRHPNRYFDPHWYLEQNADVRASGMDPLLHYLRHGEREGRKPMWCFDCAWYRQAYGVPDDTPALAHFLTMRTTGRVAPMAELWSVLHLPGYRDEPDAGGDPFAQYLDNTLDVRRDAFPDLSITASSGLVDPRLLPCQWQRCARGGTGSCRAFLPLRLAGGAQAEHLF